MSDRAKEYAIARVGEAVNFETGPACGQVSVDRMQKEIETAYHAGYLAGHTDATRRERIVPVSEVFERGMNQ